MTGGPQERRLDGGGGYAWETLPSPWEGAAKHPTPSVGKNRGGLPSRAGIITPKDPQDVSGVYLGDVPRVYVGAVSLGTSLDSEVTLKVYLGPAFWGIL